MVEHLVVGTDGMTGVNRVHGFEVCQYGLWGVCGGGDGRVREVRGWGSRGGDQQRAIRGHDLPLFICRGLEKSMFDNKMEEYTH